jgi:hypothetical protein
MKWKGLRFAEVAEILEPVTDGLKYVQKQEYSADFQKMNEHAKAYASIYANAAYSE